MDNGCMCCTVRGDLLGAFAAVRDQSLTVSPLRPTPADPDLPGPRRWGPYAYRLTGLTPAPSLVFASDRALLTTAPLDAVIVAPRSSCGTGCTRI